MGAALRYRLNYLNYIEIQDAPPACSCNIRVSQHELLMMVIIAGNTAMPGDFSHAFNLQNYAVRAGLTDLVFGLAIRSLRSKGLISINEFEDSSEVMLSEEGWKWIENNKTLFQLNKENNPV